MNEKVEQLRKLVIGQLQTVLDLYGEDIAGSDLDFSLRVAMRSISQGALSNTETADAVSTPVQTHPVTKENNPERITPNEFLGMDETYDEEDLDEYQDEENDYHMPVPNGFRDAEEYGEFLEEQNQFYADDVVGVIQDENGNTKDIGDFRESIRKTAEILEEQNTIRDDETGEVLVRNEPEPVNEITVSFTRSGNEELTNQQVLNTILASPISGPMLDAFGETYHVVDGESDNEKKVVFEIDNAREVSHVMSQMLTNGSGTIAFGGRSVIPGLGLVTAKLVL